MKCLYMKCLYMKCLYMKCLYMKCLCMKYLSTKCLYRVPDDKQSIYKMPVDKMLVNKMPVDKMSVGQMTLVSLKLAENSNLLNFLDLSSGLVVPQPETSHFCQPGSNWHHLWKIKQAFRDLSTIRTYRGISFLVVVATARDRTQNHNLKMIRWFIYLCTTAADGQMDRLNLTKTGLKLIPFHPHLQSHFLYPLPTIAADSNLQPWYDELIIFPLSYCC